jgi:hypothetical protein
MPATNFTPIQLYRTNTASTTAPSGANLNAGELAINYNDGGMILFAKNTTGTVIKLMNNPANLLYPTADGSANQAITTDGSKTLGFASVALPGSSNTFTAAQTFRAANAIRSEAASTQDAIVIAGRAGGTSSYAATITPPTLAANITLTLPAATGTLLTSTSPLAVAGNSSEGASIRLPEDTDNGTNYVAIKAPDSLSADFTCTLPATTATLGYLNLPAVGTKTGSYTLAVADVGKYVQVGSGGSITIPDATFAEGDVVIIANNTSGNITITCTITTAYIAGTDSDKATVTLATRGLANIVFLSGTVCIISGNVS